MAPHDEEDDPAVYRSGSSKNKTMSSSDATQNGHSNGDDTDNKASNGNSNSKSATEPRRLSPSNGDTHMQGEDEESDVDAEDGDDEDGTLLTVQPGFNSLLLVLRDEGVMRFVKYVSAAAEGSRWDVCGEYEVGLVEEEEEEQ